MKTVRYLLALLAASFVFAGFVRADDKHAEKAEKKCECKDEACKKACSEKKSCDCGKK